MNLKKCFYSVISKSILLFSLISILIFSSCEVGLGESVDTENPSVEITYPPNGSVIRGAFTFAGVCADDKGVSKVSVTVRKNDDANFVKEYEAKILDGGKWTCILNEVQDDKSPTALQEKAFPFADGKYEIKAVAIDSSNRQSDGISRTYEIDNTPPVFIISSPVVTDTENATEYGSIFKISGKIADDHAPLSSMKVSVFDQDGSTITGNEIWTFSKVDISGGTTVNAARYFTKENLSPEEEILYKNYINIYGENTEGDKVFTCTIEIEDSAKEWNEPNFDSKKEVVNTTEGNKTTKLYLNDSIYSLLMGADSEYQLEAGGIKDILNGTTKNDTVLSILNEKIIDTKETKLAFSLNKKANPIYSINGYDVKELNFASNSGSKNQTVTFQVQAGLNGTSVSPETFKLYLFGPFEKNALTQEEIQKIYDNPEASSKTYSEKCSVIFDGTSYSKGSVATFTQAVSLPEAISSGQVYIFAASGKDLDNLDLQTSSDTVYGFQGISAGTPPKVYISEPASDGLVIKENSSLVIKGIAESAESKIASVKYEIAVYDTLKSDENGKFKKVGEISGNAVSDSGFALPVVSYSCSVKDGTVKLENGYTSVNPGDGEIFSYAIKVTVQDDSNTESFIERNIYLDNAKPVPVITNVDPVAEKKLNGTVTVSGKVSEKNLKTFTLTITDEKDAKIKYILSESAFEKTIDTTLLPDGKITISLEAIDEAGNTSVIEENYTVDQSTDKPVIKFSNGKDSIKDFTEVNKTQNTFGVETNNKAVFNFTDDDGLEKVTITLLDKEGNPVDASVAENAVQIQENQTGEDLKPINPVVYTFDGSTTALVNYILPKKEGMYILEVEAVDVEYNNVSDREDADKVKTYRTSKTKNYIAVSDSNFNIKFNSANIINDECSTQKVETTIKGIVTVSAEEKIKSIERYEITQDKNGEWVKGSLVSSYKNDATPEKNTIKITKDANSSYVQWKEIVPVDKMQEGVKNFRYIATDTTDVSVSIDLKWNVDDTLPELHKNAYTENIADKWLNSTSQTLIYIVRDKESNGYASGIDSVKYSFKNGEKPTEGYFARGASCDEKGNEKADTKDWILYKTTFNIPEGDSTLVTVTVSDKVGNENPDEINFKIDTNAPEVSVTPSIPAEQVLQNKKTIPVEFGYTDATSGIQCIEFSTDSSMKNNLVTLTGKEIVPKYNYSLDGLSDGTYTIYVRATDNAGNKTSSISAGSVTVDNIAPKVEIKTPVSGATVNKTISFAGMVTDNNLPDGSVPVLWYNDGTLWKKVDDVSSYSTSLSGQEWTITGVDTTALNKDITPKDFEFRVVFTDKAENANKSVGESSYTLKIDQNADRPEIKLTNINITKSSISSNVVQGVISDDDGVSTKINETETKLKLYRIDSADYDADSVTNKTPSTTGNKWKSIPVEAGTGIWTATIDKDSEGEGSKHWYFYVIDEAGGEFCTKSTSPLERPYLTDGSSEKTDNTTGISFFFDTTAPTVKISLSEDGKNYSTTNTIFGGSKQLYVRAEVTEAVGMKTTEPAVLYIGGVKQTNTPSVTQNENTYTYTFNPIELLGYPADKPLSVSVIAEDSAGNTNKDILNITIDKDAPTVKIISPTTALSDAVSSSVSIKGIVQDDKSSIAKLEYVIPLTGETYSVSDGTWSNMLVTGAAWELAFTSGSEESPDSLLYYVSTANLAANKYAVNEIETGLGIYKVPVYFRTTDSVGNVAVDKTQFVYVDPNGGKPKAWINAPEQGTVTSGTVTIYGGASDNVSVSKVCVQIDVNGDGIITEADYNLIEANPYEYIGEYVEGMLVASSAVGKNDWYILAGGTSSWKCPIVTDSIVVYTGTTGTEIGTQTVTNGKKYLVSRVRAIDGDNLTRSYTDYHCITIDDTAPWFTDLAVVQYGSGETPDVNSSPIVEREYISGMYISNNSVEANGKWYLTGYVKSNTEINSIEANSLRSTSTVVIDLPEIGKGVHTVQDKTGSGTTDGYKLLIPLATDSSGMIYSELKSTNGVGTGNQTVKINIDSTAPSLYTTAGAESTTGTDALRLKSLSKMVGTDLSANSVIENSDGYFTFGDNVIEAGSGLQFIAFYLQNEIGNKVYDPMNVKSGTLISSSKTENTLYINSDNLAAFYVTKATRPTPYSLKHSSVDAAHVRKGGLVKIGGSYHTITEVTENTVTFTPAVSTSFTEAELIYAQVVDHQITEYFDTVYDSNDDAYYTLMNDDGDGMCETITQIGTTYQWTASVDSTNIPDGKTYIRVVAMDNAGNLSYGKIKSIVANNRPRMTKVFIGTDLNSSGNYDFDADEAPVVSTNSRYRTPNGTCYGEFNYYTAYNTRTGLGQSAVTLASNTFKVVSGLCIVPEFVGGNGSLKYILDKDDITTTANNTGTLTAMKNKESLNIRQVGSIPMFGTVTRENPDGNTNPVAYGGTDIGGTTYYDFGGVEISQGELSGVTSVKLTFWDETDSTSGPSINGQWATLVIPFSNMGEETNPPVPVIKPFYWNGSGDNSVLIKETGDSSASIKGHIELEGALPVDSAYTSGLPKVSGKIKIEGTVTDNVLVKSISMNVFGSSKTVATYSTGMWSQCDDLPAGVVSFTAEDKELSQNGHTVSYVAVIDTEKLNESGYPVGTNKTITINATDWNNNTSTPENTQTADSSNTAYYAMDVVPYVTEVVTHLSPFYRQAPSVYARTALGHYPVYEGETIQFVGYNLGTNKANVTIPGMPETALTSGTVGGNSVDNTIALTKNTSSATGAKSGSVSVTVNSIPALNNLNVNDAKGSYSGSVSDSGYANAYNRQPNGVNNNTLTDDLELDVWQFKNAAEPVSGGASYVTMKINPNTGIPGFSYANSILYFNMPGYDSNQNKDEWSVISGTGGTVYSQIPFGMNYGGFSHNSFAFDKNGYSYGAAMCTDTSKANESAFFQFFSREAPLPISHMEQNMNYANTWNASRLDCSSVPVKGDDSGWTTDIDRIQSISMDTSVNGSTYVFMAYYDQPLKQVRFRWGTVRSSGTNSFGGNGLNDVVSSEYTGVAQAREYDTTCRPSNVKDSYIKYSYNQNNGLPIQVVAASGVSGARGAYRNAVNGGAGKYVSLSIANKDTSSPVAIVTWYDSVNMQLKMAYNTAPTTSNTWTVRVIDKTGGINVKTAVDKDNHIHFAYYDNINGSDLKYAYLDSYDSSSEPTIVTVDSFSAVGAKCTIDVAKDSAGNWVPYIGYQLSSYLGTPLGAKVAYRTDFSKLGDGATKERYTGLWECSIVPTQSIPNDDQINVGVYRNSDGYAQAFTSNSYWSSGDTAPGQTMTNSILNVGNPTILHGNNTANPIIGYGIDTGAIEMAQKK